MAASNEFLIVNWKKGAGGGQKFRVEDDLEGDIKRNGR